MGLSSKVEDKQKLSKEPMELKGGRLGEGWLCFNLKSFGRSECSDGKVREDGKLCHFSFAVIKHCDQKHLAKRSRYWLMVPED